MSDAKEKYYSSGEPISFDVYNDYIQELEQENKEMLECLKHVASTIKSFGSNISDCGASKLVEKITGKSCDNKIDTDEERQDNCSPFCTICSSLDCDCNFEEDESDYIDFDNGDVSIYGYDGDGV